MIHARVDGPQLRRHIVRIGRTEDNALLGTGFFVAPGWILTAAHVVYGYERLAIEPHPEVSGPISATVAACSPPPVGRVLWPFPDLAVLRLDADIGHPSALLSAADPDDAQDCYASGHAQLDPGEASPQASPTSFRFEGRQDDGFLKLKAGQAAPGLSGAPLVCSYRRAVVGVISATRDRSSDLGAWASPIAALFDDLPAVSPELAALGRQLRALNRTAVAADRTAWNRVLPVEGADGLLDRNWGSFSRQRHSSPADLLRADLDAVPYRFRDADLDFTVTWCETGPDMAIAVVAGSGGAGKTRFAIELCKRMITRHWIAGLWPDSASVTSPQRINDLIKLSLPRLVVIDYAEASAADALRATLADLCAHATALAPVRVLFLARTTSRAVRDLLDEIGRDAPGRLRTVLDAAEELHSPTEDLHPGQRAELYRAALVGFADKWRDDGPVVGSDAAPGAASDPDLADGRYALPLEVLFEALDHAFTGGPRGAQDPPPVHRVLEHESKYWAATAPADLSAELRRRCVALATLAGAADESEAHNLLTATTRALAPDSAEELRASCVDWLAGLYPGGALLNPLRPDRLGEALVSRLLRDERAAVERGGPPLRAGAARSGRGADPAGALLGSVLTLPGNYQVASCLDVLARLAAYDQVVALSVCAALAELHAQLVGRAEAQARETREQPGRTTVTGGLIRLFAGEVGQRLIDVRAGDAGFQNNLALTFTRLGDLATRAGQYAQAERIYAGGLEIRQRLAEVVRGLNQYMYDVSASYERLGAVAHRTGDVRQAERHFREAIAAAEAAVRRDPANAGYRHALAEYHGRLSAELLAARRVDEAMECSRAGSIIREQARRVEAGLPPIAEPEPDALEPTVDARAAADAPVGPASLADHAVTGTGTVVTFYSFKGGVGRSMALANVAWILAANGRRVLVVDFDLEAPGLERYFHPFLSPAAVGDSPGVIDMIRQYQVAAMRQTREQGQQSADWQRDFARVEHYSMSLDWTFPGRGCLHLMAAGRQNSDYSASISALDWDNFYARLGGGRFFEALREDMRANYDYVLIDSRPGVNDLADICMSYLPDVVVDCFTLNTQSIEGGATIARRITSYSRRDIRIYPVIARVDQTEEALLAHGRALTRARFAGFPQGLDPDEAARYWLEAEIPYQPFYAFRELLAGFGDEESTPGSLLAAMERLTGWITAGSVTSLPPLAPVVRRRVLGQFDATAGPQYAELGLIHASEDQLWADWITKVLNDADFAVFPIDESEAGAFDEALAGLPTLVLLSSASLRRAPVIDRVYQAARGTPAQRALLIPVAISPVELAAPLAELPSTDLDGLDEAAATAAVLRAVRELGPVPNPAVRFPTPLPETGPRFPGRQPTATNLPPRNSRFFGREAPLADVRSALTSEGEPVLLHGLGGVGKTQIALEYAHRFAAGYDVVWWINAEQPESVESALVDLGAWLHMPGEDRDAWTAAEVIAALSEPDSDRRWLVILDNLDPSDRLNTLMPTRGGHVLATSRSPLPEQTWATIEVDVFDRAESIGFFRSVAAEYSEADADEIAAELGDLPLAIDVAAAWLTQTGQSAAEYLAALRSVEITPVQPGNAARTLRATWDISLERLAAQSPAAARLLELCAFCAPEVSLELIQSHQMMRALVPYEASLRAPMMMGRVIQFLGRYALAKVDRQRHSIEVHRLVQAHVRDGMDEAKRGDAVHTVHRILAAARPSRGDVDDPRNWPRYQLIWPHLGPSEAVMCDEEEVRYLVIDRVIYLHRRGDLDGAAALAQEAEAAWSAALRGESVQAADELLLRQLLHLRSQRAALHRSRGQFAAAAQLDQDVLAQQQALFPPGDLHTLMTTSGVAADQRALGRFAEALATDRSALDELVQVYGADHERSLATTHDVATDLSLAGDCQGALDLDRDTLERRRAILGRSHPDTLASAQSLARDLRDGGEFRESAALLQSTHSEYLEVLGPEFAETMRTATSMSISLRCTGEHGRAREVAEETYSRFETEFGADMPDAVACGFALAASVAATGESGRALQLTRAIHKTYERLLGVDHPFTLSTLDNLAVYLLRFGRNAEGLPLARSAADQFETVLGPRHRSTLTARLNLANCLAANGEHRAAAALDEVSCPAFAEILGEHHFLTLVAELNLARSLHDIGEEDRGMTVYREALPQLAQLLGEHHPTVAAVRSRERISWELEVQPL